MSVDVIALFVAIPVVALVIAFVFFVRAEATSRIEGEAERASFWKDSRRVGYWASASALALVYLLAGVPKLGGFSATLHRFESWGYSDEFMMFIGISEFVAAIFLLIPRTALYAALYLGVIMFGAIYTHLAFDSAVMSLLPAFCLSFLTFVGFEAYARQRKQSAVGRSTPAAGA